jgi:hypothetical protein
MSQLNENLKKYVLPNQIPEDFQMLLKNMNILECVKDRLN